MASSTLACDCVNHINGNWESVEHALNNFDSNVGRVALSSTTQLHKVLGVASKIQYVSMK